MINYFAYGSNLASERMQKRIPSAEVQTIGSLREHSLRFHKVSSDGSGKADAFQTKNLEDLIHGVIWNIANNDDLLSLDLIEGVGYGYERKVVEVETQDGVLSAFTYSADLQYIDNSLVPYDWYKDLVLAGAKEHGFREEYIRQIESVESKPDSDLARVEKNRLKRLGS